MKQHLRKWRQRRNARKAFETRRNIARCNAPRPAIAPALYRSRALEDATAAFKRLALRKNLSL